MTQKKPKSLTWLEIFFKEPASSEQATMFLERLATADEIGTVALEVRARKKRSGNNEVRWLVAVDENHCKTLECLLTNLLPVRIKRLDKEAYIKARQAVITCGKARISKPSLSLDPNRNEAVSRALLAALANLSTGQYVTIQTVLGQRLYPRIIEGKKINPTWLDLLLGKSRNLPSKEGLALKARHAHHGFRAELRIGVRTGHVVSDVTLMRQIFGALRVMEAAGSRMYLCKEDPSKLNELRRPWRYQLALSTAELSGLIGLPVGQTPLPSLGSKHPQLISPEGSLSKTERTFAQVAAVGDTRPVGLSIKDSLYHTLLMGPSGCGKSTTMLSKIENSIHSGQGVLVIDPKTDLVTDVLNRIPKSRQKDVVVIDPICTHPVGLNPLQDSKRSPELVADSLLNSFRQLFESSWGVRTEDILTASALTLARTENTNLIWLPTLLSDVAFRRNILKDIHDPLGVEDFWQRFESKRPDSQNTEIQPVLNKLRQFLLRPAMRAVLGQSEPRFHLRELLTDKKIVLVSLNKGILGAESARLLGALLVSQLWSLILERAELPATRRSAVSVFIDEVQDYLKLPVDLADGLAQARGLGVSFCLAHQYRGQLPVEMPHAIDANCRNKIIFGLASADDARDIAKLSNDLEAQDFMLLPQYHAYANLMQDGKASGWMAVKTSAPSTPVSNAAELKAASAKRYGVSAKETESKLIELLRGSSPDAKDVKEAPIGRKSAS